VTVKKRDDGGPGLMNSKAHFVRIIRALLPQSASAGSPFEPRLLATIVEKQSNVSPRPRRTAGVSTAGRLEPGLPSKDIFPEPKSDLVLSVTQIIAHTQ
jgi:hypothetical protein